MQVYIKPVSKGKIRKRDSEDEDIGDRLGDQIEPDFALFHVTLPEDNICDNSEHGAEDNK